MTFGRLAVSDFELGMDVIVLLIYCTVLYLDFARWSILDGVDSRILVKLLVTCIISCVGSGIFWTGFFEMPEEYIMVEHAVDRSLERAVRLWRYVKLE